ncbi:hypothetical protein [Halobacterium wangiae]|uniref:hypothetical protein n=1 Tax=Halobacterium wangiae TaxID=2902623 RepID=UPI001E39FE5A|nr:hypothetical protein [Halobacterium wangiae]
MNGRFRRVALGVLLALLVASAGCNAFDDGPATNLLLVNNDDQRHDVRVEVLQDGETQYTSEKTLPAESQADLSSFEGSGEYTVAVTVDGTTTGRTHEFGSDDETLSIGVQNDGSVIVGG